MLNFFKVLGFVIFAFQLNGQTKVIKHFNSYDSLHNKNWLEHQQEQLDSIHSSTCSWIEKNDYHYFNRFIGLLPHRPINTNILLERFKEGFFFEPNGFCARVNEKLEQYLSFNAYAKTYFKDELEIIGQYCECQLNSYNMDLIEKLKIILNDDQEYRIDPSKALGKRSQKIRDSINIEKIEEIIEEFGYPGRKLVGVEYEDVVFLVIQHSNLALMEKYLPLIEYNVKVKNLSPRLLPFLYDRIEMINGRPQIFGTQFTIKDNAVDQEMYDLYDPINVNFRRHKYGLYYLKDFPISK